MIARCHCLHEYQDRKYGRGLRVFNPYKDGAGLRCTACGQERGLSSDERLPASPGKSGKRGK